MSETTAAAPPDITPAPPIDADPTAPRPGRRHLHDVDVVRFTTVLGVLCVHATSLFLTSNEVSGAALAVLHVTREVFLFLSAFVLAYSAKGPIAVRRFWRRRFPLVLAPYVVWSAIYVLADGDLGSPFTVFTRFAKDLLSGAAHFHLYFLLLTMQLYIVFPWLLGWLRRRSHHGRILLVAIAWQLLFTCAIYFNVHIPVVSVWLHHPGTWLPSYVPYVIAGALAALHFDEVRAWVVAHQRLIAVSAVAILAAVLGLYEVDVHAWHQSFLHAGGEFGPGVVIGACAAIAVQFALGLRVATRAGPRVKRFLVSTSDVSFGVYLAHPLLYMVVLDVLSAFHQSGFRSLPSGVGMALIIFALAPLTYLITAAAVWLVRQTPLSLALTGRRAKPRPRPALA